VGDLESTEVVGLLLGDDDDWLVGKEVGCFEGATDAPPLLQVPLWHTPKGIELQGVKSGKACGEGQLPSGLHGEVISHSVSFPHRHSCSCACL